MWGKRILWLLGILFLSALYILSGRAVYAAAAAAAVIVPWFSLILLQIGSHKTDVSFRLSESAAKNEEFSLEPAMSGSFLLSALSVQIWGSITNQLTGEIQPFKVDFDSGEPCLFIESPHCGKLSVDIHKLCLKDPLGLFRRRKQLHSHASILILPNTFEPSIELQVPDAADLNSDEYSTLFSGDDPSELFGIRDYREGDPLRSIHWKLSEKYDRTIVKEMSRPVANAILLVLDNCPTSAFAAEAADRVCEALISVSQALADLYVSHHLAWFNHETGQFEAVSIASLDDLAGEKGRILSSRIHQCSEGIVMRALESDEINSVQHILIFAPVSPEGIEALECDVSVLLPEETPENAISCLPEKLTRLLV